MEKFRDSKLYKEKPYPWNVIKKNDGTYMLKCDGEIAPKIKHKHQFHIPPQPFQGNPDAAIWVLLANPGYAEGEEKSCYGDNIAYLENCGDQKINSKRDARLAACRAQHELKKTGKYYNLKSRKGYTLVSWIGDIVQKFPSVNGSVQSCIFSYLPGC